MDPIIVDLSQLQFAVTDKHNAVAISLHQHPDAAQRFIDAYPQRAGEFRIVDIETGKVL